MLPAGEADEASPTLRDAPLAARRKSEFSKNKKPYQDAIRGMSGTTSRTVNSWSWSWSARMAKAGAKTTFSSRFPTVCNPNDL